MSPPRTRLDPEGYYAQLGLEPSASAAAIIAAFRARARVLHPDVPNTGNAEAFVVLRQAYDVLSNGQRRQDYDRASRRAALETIEPEVFASRPVHPVPSASPPPPPKRSYSFPIAIAAGFGAVLCVGVTEVVLHMEHRPPVVSAAIRPNAATIEPLSPEAHFTTLYGPDPVQLAGTPNFYVVPGMTRVVLWRLDPARNGFVPDRQLPPFSAVQAVRFVRQSGMLEVLVKGQANGYVEADRVTPGDALAARRAYCSYNAGPAPVDGELLDRAGHGGGRLRVDNRAVQPVVVKLRDRAGVVAVSVFLGPGGHADVADLPDGPYQAEFAIGELWSRACRTFAAGMRARRFDEALTVSASAHLEINSDAANPPSSDIDDREFEQN